MKFFKRFNDSPLFLQEELSYIVLGRRTQIYNVTTKRWFRVSDRPRDPNMLRQGCDHFLPISRKAFLRHTGISGWIAIIEEVLGIRSLSRWWEKRHPPPEIDEENLRPPRIVRGGDDCETTSAEAARNDCERYHGEMG